MVVLLCERKLAKAIRGATDGTHVFGEQASTTEVRPKDPSEEGMRSSEITRKGQPPT
jgi:hypothetical protein